MRIGIDLGSSTAKFVALGDENQVVYKTYRRHNGKVKETLLEILSELPNEVKNEKLKILITGSAGMGLAARIDIPFTQEVIVLSKAVRTLYPDASTFIELGGEDAKIVLFKEGQTPEMKMNGSCAGGTGSFIDQMATLLNVDLPTLNELAKNGKKELFIASRCGVFAKTDVQALLNKGEKKEDIAKGVFKAVANQTITTLLAGAEINPKIIFAGGPLTFLSSLRDAFYRTINLPESDFVLPENSETLVAIGAALIAESKGKDLTFDQLSFDLKNEKKGIRTIRTLEPLFSSEKEYSEFKARHNKLSVKTLDAKDAIKARELFLGIDAGSTTMKLLLINENNHIVDSYYSGNKGTPLDSAIDGLKYMKKHFTGNRIKAVFATGYGEEFIKKALNLDGGIVETMAHFTAGSLFNDKISYIVDVGGQDIKSMKIENGIVGQIQLNEACSSGTGSFIQTFAKNLDMTLDEFVQAALFAENPVDLGSRCSVFMNSKVKEALKDGVPVSDIAAGLAYSVVKNALYKVIEIKSVDELGENVFVQGGTFKNDAVLRAFELLVGKNVYRLNISEFMGAFGAALYAKDFYALNPDYQTKFDFESIDNLTFTKRVLTCHGCGNNCSVTQFKFSNNNKFYTGNRCEAFFSNKSSEERVTDNFFREKEEMMFNNIDEFIDKDEVPPYKQDSPVIGIPRVLSVYEHYPFFYALFRKVGIRVQLSDTTTRKMYYKGLRTVAADNLCLPAKVANGHAIDLIEKEVDRIFYPSIVYEQKESDDAQNSFNCPIVSGYGEVLKRTIKTDIPIDSFPLSFQYMSGFKKNFFEYVKEYGVTKAQVDEAVEYGFAIERKINETLRVKASNIIEKAKAENKPLFIVMGRPYHLDPIINTGILDMLNDLGAYAIPESAIPDLHKENLEGVVPLTQWSYHNRLYLAAKWMAKQSYDKLAAIQLNSFGCGPDAVVVDEVKALVEAGNKIYISIKIDEMSNLGAAKIRIRSVLEALKQSKKINLKPRKYAKRYSKSERRKTIIVPYFARLYSELMEPIFHRLGYNIVTLHKQSQDAVEEGLRFVNNDMCYPAIIVIGDLLKALKSGKYDPDNSVVALTQTNGQCRASNYVPLLKKALVDSGFVNTPVITLSADSFAEGFVFNPGKFIKYTIILYSIADVLMKLRSRTKAYEVHHGDAECLFDRLQEELIQRAYETPPNKKMLIDFVQYAIREFNKIDVDMKRKVKKVGVVGEIYLKNNDFSNNYLVNWIENRGFEVVVPSYLKFFEYGYYSQVYMAKEKIQTLPFKLTTRGILHLTIAHYRKIYEKEMENFKLFDKNETSIPEAIKNKNDILPGYLQFGEGWLLPMEIATMSREGVKDVISVQPFGCISNHIVAKGVYRQLKEDYGVNLLLLDYESGTSNTNTENRLELFLSEN